METDAGTVLPATHLFGHPNIVRWMTAQSDPNGRPLLLPETVGSAQAVIAGSRGDQAPVGYTGERLLNLAVFQDGNIPASGSNAQLLIADPSEIYALATEPVARAFPETFAQNLSVVVQSYMLAGAVVRHSNAVQVLSSAAYLQTPSFA
jgi:hypothetical protein